MSDSSEEEVEFTGDQLDEEVNDDSSDDVPLAQLKTAPSSSSPTSRGRAAKKRMSYNEQDDDEEEESSDDEDDIPLAALAKQKNGMKQPSKKQASPKKKPKKLTKKPSSVSVASTSSKKTFDSASAALYSECQKGQLVQALLCRWWYAITWPDPTTLPAVPPKHYDTLDGFPGVYVCTSGDKVGHLLDLRDASKAPSFANLIKKPTEELQELLVQACQEQMRQLTAIAQDGSSNGNTSATQQELKKLEQWARKLKPDKVDKEAVKVLKANKLQLP